MDKEHNRPANEQKLESPTTTSAVDTSMRETSGLLTTRVLRFLGKNDDLPVATEHGVLFRFYDEDGWIRFLVEINESTSIKDIEKSWWLIMEWRKRLTEYQGHWTRGGPGYFYQRLSDYWRGPDTGLSYQQVADRINKRIGELLVEYAGFMQEFEEAKSQFRTYLDYLLWSSETQNNQFSLDHADDLLQLCCPSMSDQQRGELLQAALEDVMAGRPPFPAGFELVTAEDVRARLRQWRKKTDSQ